ncbi:MAG: ferredoxin--NADP reductase [Myxococcota bacterium]
MPKLLREEITHVHHWTDGLFSFRTTRDRAFRFESGQFTMIGLEVEGKPLLRAYSVVSAYYDDHLEFLSVKVPDGALTSRLRHIEVGDELLVGAKPTGTLLADDLHSGRNLYLLATGTGLAPFLSLVRDPDVYARFEKVVLVHGVRKVADLAYHDWLQGDLLNDDLVGGHAQEQLIYAPSVTREAFHRTGRITDQMRSGALAADLGLPELDAEHDRVLVCGNPEMTRDSADLLEARGFVEARHGARGHYAVERAFVDSTQRAAA